MKKLGLLFAALLALTAPALAQTSNGRATTAAPTYTNNTAAPLSLDLDGSLRVTCDATCSGGGGGGSVDITAVGGNAVTTSVPVSGTVSVNALPAGSNIIGNVRIDQTTPGTTNGVQEIPSAATAASIAAVVSPSAESGRVLKASAGNLYSLYVTTGAAAGYLMVFNSTTVPADGAVTPIQCVIAPALSTVSLNFSAAPEQFTTGISAAFSTTGCFTKTASATAFFNGETK